MTIETELPAVKVKALEWPSECPRGRRVSGNGLVVYCIAHYGGDIGDPIYRWAAPLSSWSKPFYSFDEAKAGAQADYERRILSALTLKDDPGNGGDGGAERGNTAVIWMLRKLVDNPAFYTQTSGGGTRPKVEITFDDLEGMRRFSDALAECRLYLRDHGGDK